MFQIDVAGANNRPEQLWVSDIIFIRMKNQWGYLSMITDAFSRKIMGIALRSDMLAQGCIDALHMALLNRQYEHNNLIHHSERGSQYCCKEYIAMKDTVAVKGKGGTGNRKSSTNSRRIFESWVESLGAGFRAAMF